MQGISLKIISDKLQQIWGLPSYTGEITIDSFKEEFDMPVGYWSKNDYEQQWRDGVRRIHLHDQSCLITKVQDPQIAPAKVNWWLLYKKGEKVYIHNQLLFGKKFRKKIEQRPFTTQTCYDYIPPYEPYSDDGTNVSEWTVNLKDI